MAKDVEISHKPTNYSFSPTLKANQDLKWSKGMISQSGTLRGGDIIA